MKELVIPKVWRSELGLVILFLVTCVATVFLSTRYPASVITGPLFSYGDYHMSLSLPLLWFVPAIVLGMAMYRIYNVRYSLDSKGVVSVSGRLALHQTITRIRYEDIRSVETEQSIIERILNIGCLELGTAATGGLEMILYGIASPSDVRFLIENERDQRQNLPDASEPQQHDTRDAA